MNPKQALYEAQRRAWREEIGVRPPKVKGKDWNPNQREG